MNLYKEMPANRKIATFRAKRLKKYLDNKTGVSWKIRVHENLGWHYSCTYGSLYLSEHASSYGGGGYHLMNSGEMGAGCGHIELQSYSFKKRDNILPAIMKSLLDQKNFVEQYIAGYNQNSKITRFKPIKL